MPRTRATMLVQRLDRLASRLTSADERLTIDGLAEEFGVSRRTLNRDIELLRERGVPVQADRGRGGGVRAERRWSVGRLTLSYREAVDLLVSLAIARQLGSAILLADLESIRHKVAATLAPELARRVRGLTKRILIGHTASVPVLGSARPTSPSVSEHLNQAFLQQNALNIRYQGADGALSERCIEPHYLLLNHPLWYVLAWDRLRQARRTFRRDRIRRAERVEEAFVLRPVAEFQEASLGTQLVFP